MNPCYSNYTGRWQKMRDSFDGEQTMKDQTLGQNSSCKCPTVPNEKLNQYLRMSQGLKMDQQNGWAKFCDYVYRAMYYPFPAAIHSQSLGMINAKKSTFELPNTFSYMETNATANQEPIKNVLSMIHSEQILMGRIGIMLEVNEGTTTAQNTFNIVKYPAESIIDWVYTMQGGEQVPSFVNSSGLAKMQM
jgi:hypothetical protein